MNGGRAKSIRRYVRQTFPFLPEGAVYTRRPNGCVVMLPQCSRATVKKIKKNFLRRRRGLQLV